MTMSNPLVSVSHLVRIARLYPGAAVVPPAYQSLPVPAVAQQRLHALFLYGDGRVDEEVRGYQIWPPRYMAGVDAATARFEFLRAVSPRDLDLGDDPTRPMGPGRPPAADESAADLERRARFFQAWDALAVGFAERSSRPPPELLATAREFRHLFTAIAEVPLVPYYRAVGTAFFSWLDHLPE